MAFIPLSDPNAWVMYLIMVVGGALGGFVAELLLRNGAGQLERPRRLKGFLDLGFFSNIIIGIVASLVVFAFLGPTSEVVGERIQQGFQLRTLVGVSLLAGTAGGTIITTLQERLVAALKLEQAQALDTAVQGALNKMLASAETQPDAPQDKPDVKPQPAAAQDKPDVKPQPDAPSGAAGVVGGGPAAPPADLSIVPSGEVRMQGMVPARARKQETRQVVPVEAVKEALSEIDAVKDALGLGEPPTTG